MHIGEVIKKHRKEKDMTQEEVAKRLGVTAPAVNKWEKGSTMPDIGLLSPLARLFGISVDELLSHKEELTDVQANEIAEELYEKLKTEDYDTVFLWAKAQVEQYPNSMTLLLWTTQMLDSYRNMEETPNADKYDDYMKQCYTRVLECGNETVRNNAADALFYFYVHKNEYAEAEKCLAYFSSENPERKRKQAWVYSKQGKTEEAYKMYEELLYAAYQSVNQTFHGIYLLALEEKNMETAHRMGEKMQDLARLFEMGRYHEVSNGLELAVIEKDVEKTLQIVKIMLENTEGIMDFTKAPLYKHMGFREIDDAYIQQVREGPLEGFREEECYVYMRENEEWKKLLKIEN